MLEKIQAVRYFDKKKLIFLEFSQNNPIKIQSRKTVQISLVVFFSVT